MERKSTPSSAVLRLLGDDAARSILAAADGRPRSVQALDEHCEASMTTIYRRVEDLLEHDLLRSRTEVRSDGNHHETYESNLEGFSVRLSGGAFDVEIDRRDDPPNRLRGIWDAMGSESQ